MTSEEYNFYKFFIEAIIVFAGFLLGGGAGIYVESRWHISSRINARFTQKVRIIKKLRIYNFFSNWSINFNGTRKAVDKSKKDIRQSLEPSTPLKILNPNQVSICSKVTEFSKAHTSQEFNPQSSYEKAVREHNTPRGIEVAAREYHQLFNEILNIISNYAISNGAEKQIEALVFLVRGLGDMLQKPTDKNKLREQVRECEMAILNVFSFLPLPYGSD